MTERLTAALEDRYRLEGELGAGGMATVYLAADLKHDRKVALKVLKPELAAVVGKERFLAEIRTTANLRHPHILPLYDSGEAAGLLWYAMPFVEGESLRERLDREKQLPVDEAVAIAVKVAGALQAAHEAGIVHRDIKPANILLEKGEPVVADFGIALAVSEAGGGRLTETGLSVGTPYYMSPEQATGDRDPDARSDVYALAAVLYEMLLGEPPFSGGTAQAVLGKILTGDPTPPHEVRRSVPLNVSGAVHKGLEKLPADRFASASGFAEALRDSANLHGASRVTAAFPGGGSGSTSSPVWKPAALVLGLLSLILAGVAFWPSAPAPSDEPVYRVQVDLVDGATRLGVFNRMDLSRDGRLFVYEGSGGEGNPLRIRDLSRLESRILPGTEGAVTPAFSPDGRRVAYVALDRGSGRQLRVISVDGGPPVTLTDDHVDAGGARWGDDGFIYYDTGYDDDGFSRIPADGSGGPELLTHASDGNWHTPQDVLPGGRGVLYYNRVPERIEVLDLATRETRPLVEGTGARYAHSGHMVWVDRVGTLFAAPFDLQALELSGPAVPLAGDVRTLTFGGVDLTVSATGVLIHALGSASSLPRLGFIDDEGRTIGESTSWPGYAFDLARYPASGRTVARVRSPDGATASDLWLAEDDGGPPTRLTFTGDVVYPVFSPDGSAILYVRSNPEGAGYQGVFRLQLNPLGTPELVAEASVVLLQVVTRGGEVLLVAGAQAGTTGSGETAVIAWGITRDGRPTSGPDTLFMKTNYSGNLSVSPDGRWVAFDHMSGGSPQVSVKPWQGPREAEWTVSDPVGVQPLWTADGSALTWINPAEGTLRRLDIEEGVSFRTGEMTSVPLPPGYTLFTSVQQMTSGSTAGNRPIIVYPENDQATLVMVTGLHRLLEETAGPGG